MCSFNDIILQGFMNIALYVNCKIYSIRKNIEKLTNQTKQNNIIETILTG